jgi:hypothetical protein
MNPPGLLLAAGGFKARPRTRNISLRHVMAKRIALANPTTRATGITEAAGGGAKSG